MKIVNLLDREGTQVSPKVHIDSVFTTDGVSLGSKLEPTSSGVAITGSATATTFIGSLQGNATSASKLATARTITLTGDVTGSVSFDGSTNVNLATTVDAIQTINGTTPITASRSANTVTLSHASSGVTAGNYGPPSSATIRPGGTFSIPYVTVNATGHVTGAATRTMTFDSAALTLSTTTSNRYLLASTATSGSISTAYIDSNVYADSNDFVHTGGVYIGDAYIQRNSTTGALEFHTS